MFSCPKTFVSPITEPWKIKAGRWKPGPWTSSLRWGKWSKVKSLDMRSKKMAAFTLGKAVFVLVGNKVAISVGLDQKGHLEIYNIALEQDFLHSAGGFLGE